jgi:SAM-dependent methyltransferase
MTGFAYVGTELDLFARATNWKAYWSERLRPFVGPRVLDVGAGLGATARILAGGVERWCCLEPDPLLAGRLEAAVASGDLPAQCEVVRGVLDDVRGAPYDSVLYVDVLEHIDDDRTELASASRLVSPGGHLVVLAPAHNWLFSRFDESVGHHRRYDRRRLRQVAPPECDLVSLAYLDSVGMILSLANRFVLRRAVPTPANIAFWDRVVIPVSRRIDPLLRYAVGKSIVATWRKR